MTGQSDADLLRRAATLMRERAEDATAGPWGQAQGASGAWWIEAPYTATIADIDIDSLRPEADAVHIASWHPAVALAVADWLDKEADGFALIAATTRVAIEIDGDLRVMHSTHGEALAVARAYLGGTQRACRTDQEVSA